MALRVPCDQCRRRRVRCNGDGSTPCDKCISAGLRCKHEYVPKRRGPKRGVGKVIAQLRSQEELERQNSLNSMASSLQRIDGRPGTAHHHHLQSSPVLLEAGFSPASVASLSNSDSLSPVTHTQVASPSILHDIVPRGPHIIPTDCGDISVIRRCVDLFLEHIYPIKPIFNRPALETILTRPMEIHEKNLIYALCAMTATHMSGRPEYNQGQLSWISLGRFFLGKCIATRQVYDFIEDRTLFAVISSYFLFEAYFELDEQRKSWYYLQEATTLAQELGLQEESSYTGLPFIESVCRRRTFWLLFVTERAIAVFRHKPLKLSKTPEYPLEKLDYEGIEVQQSLMSLIETFQPLNADFVNMWNQSDYDISNPRLGTTWSEDDLDAHQTDFTIFADSQKADVLVTQQWIRLLVWQCALRKGLLSSFSPNPSRTFKYPLEIASRLIGIVSRMPKSSIMVHGIGIFEKIFDVACSVIDVASTHNLDLIELNTPDYVGSHTFLTFMQILSFTPNSQKIFATALQEKAANQPEILRSAIRSGLTMLAPHHQHHIQQQRHQHEATVESVIEEEEDVTPTSALVSASPL